VGTSLAMELRRHRTPVVIIEMRPDRARKLAEAVNALIIDGDGTDLSLLEGLELRASDFVIAVTGIDQENLVACELARTAFGVTRVLARLNDPKNRRTFSALQIPVVSVTDLLVSVISREIDITELIDAAVFDLGDLETVEVVIPSSARPCLVRELGLPDSTVVVAVTRAESVFVPDGGTVLEPGDQLLIVTQSVQRDTTKDVFANLPAGDTPVEVSD
jgi:trk system potassium uptake protein TrkA